MRNQATDKTQIFESMPVSRALRTMAVPTIISQLINLIYNMVDAFFIGRTGNSYMMAATSLTLTLVMMNTALSNLFGVGGGSLVARLLGAGEEKEARRASAFSVYGGLLIGLIYAALVWIFLDPLLLFFGASEATLDYARVYTLIVTVAGSMPAILSMTLAHLLRNAGYSSQASRGLSLGGVLNIALDPLFMFVLLPRGNEVAGAAIATLLSNLVAVVYLLIAYRGAVRTAPLSLSLKTALETRKRSVREIFAVGVPSVILTGLFDVANISVNRLAAAHSDLVLAGMGIVMKVERIPNAINVGLCQGMLPIVAYNYSSGNHERKEAVIRTARIWGLVIAGVSILSFQLLALPLTRFFMSTGSDNAELAGKTIAFAELFLRIRCLASPSQFINYHTSYCMQAMGNGRETMLHSVVRQLVIYIPMMILLDRLFGETGLAAALPVSETLSAVFAFWLLRKILKTHVK